MSKISKKLGLKPPSWKGKKHSKETRLKMSVNRKRIGSPWNVGKKYSEEHCKKISDARKGIIFTEEHKEKLRQAKIGSKSPTWKGGVTKLPEYTAWHSRQRRLRKLNAQGGHTIDQWKELKSRYNYFCPSCWKSEPEIKLTEDHIAPLSRGGSDDISNIQPLCMNCNQRKCVQTIRFEMIIL